MTALTWALSTVGPLTVTACGVRVHRVGGPSREVAIALPVAAVLLSPGSCSWPTTCPRLPGPVGRHQHRHRPDLGRRRHPARRPPPDSEQGPKDVMTGNPTAPEDSDEQTGSTTVSEGAATTDLGLRYPIGLYLSRPRLADR